MANTTKKTAAAKSTPAKKTATAKTAPAKTAAKKAPAKKAAAKRAPAKKPASSSKVKLGSQVFVPVNPAHNNGVAEAPATVTNVLDVKGESRVNVRVHMDAEHDVHLTNVLVTTRTGAKKATADGQRVAFTSPSS